MPRRGMGVEIFRRTNGEDPDECHAPQGHGSRNYTIAWVRMTFTVMPRRGMGVEIFARINIAA